MEVVYKNKRKGVGLAAGKLKGDKKSGSRYHHRPPHAVHLPATVVARRTRTSELGDLELLLGTSLGGSMRYGPTWESAGSGGDSGEAGRLFFGQGNPSSSVSHIKKTSFNLWHL